MIEENFSYGVISYSSINIGDEVQSVAVSRFLPRIDEYVQRETVKKFVPKHGKKTKLIMNAWWMFNPKNFPPKDEYIEPLLISMYFSDTQRHFFLNEERRNFLLKHGPVGCRDMGTYNWLQSENIPSYFSGCLTITLQRNYSIPRQDYILCVDVPEDIIEEIKKHTKRPVYDLTRRLFPIYTPQKRMELAKLMLRLYHDAHLVISPRFHILLPSLAMETPVLRLATSNRNIVADHTRFMGYETFFNTIDIDKDDWINEIRKFDFENPPNNPQNHLKMREDLIKRCSEFTGYNNSEPIIDSDPYPFARLIQLNACKDFHVRRMAYWSTKKELLETLLCKLKYGITKYDVTEDNLPLYEKIKYPPLMRIKYYIYMILSTLTLGKTRKKFRKIFNKYAKIKICYELQKLLNNEFIYPNIIKASGSSTIKQNPETLAAVGGGLSL